MRKAHVLLLWNLWKTTNMLLCEKNAQVRNSFTLHIILTPIFLDSHNVAGMDVDLSSNLKMSLKVLSITC